MSINLKGLTLTELNTLRSKVDAAIQRLELTNLTKARIEAAKLAKEYGIPLESLIVEEAVTKSTRKKTVKPRKKVAPKYRHPEDTSLTWTGRGLKPKWIVLLLETGIKLEDLEIQ